ncbi:hypothetical protein FSP39_017132 [Pinctada imbricata]|uniref:Uncharacterized protein n=1 Tax=Pinctada imbricata TaxID=66713 RepID=A0AA89C095_PINIB|nr:hypothetical protein FSP39_017132 [Pinctada imbricata]
MADKSDGEDAAHLTWLRTTVYAVIGCTVSVVLTISLIVIAVFRVRMKQSVYRHTERALRRRNISNRNRYSARLSENDPFLNYTPGNIIVNVNNGVQFIPGSEFTSLVGRPPSYSEIDNDGNRQHESPPPSYSTIDRNPIRGPINFDDYIIQQSSLTAACATCLPTLSRDSSIISDSESYIQFQLGPMPQMQNASVQTSNTGATNSPQHVSSACTDTPPPVRQPVLTVQQGQIVLSGYAVESQNISMSENSSQVSPAHLRVERGQIILTNDPTSVPPDIHLDHTVQGNEEILRPEENPSQLGDQESSIILVNTSNSIPVSDSQMQLENNESPLSCLPLRSDAECTRTATPDDIEMSHVNNDVSASPQNSSNIGHKTDNSDIVDRNSVNPDETTLSGETDTNQLEYDNQPIISTGGCDEESPGMINQTDNQADEHTDEHDVIGAEAEESQNETTKGHGVIDIQNGILVVK